MSRFEKEILPFMEEEIMRKTPYIQRVQYKGV